MWPGRDRSTCHAPTSCPPEHQEGVSCDADGDSFGNFWHAIFRAHPFASLCAPCIRSGAIPSTSEEALRLNTFRRSFVSCGVTTLTSTVRALLPSVDADPKHLSVCVSFNHLASSVRTLTYGNIGAPGHSIQRQGRPLVSMTRPLSHFLSAGSFTISMMFRRSVFLSNLASMILGRIETPKIDPSGNFQRFKSEGILCLVRTNAAVFATERVSNDLIFRLQCFHCLTYVSRPCIDLPTALRTCSWRHEIRTRARTSRLTCTYSALASKISDQGSD